MRERWVTDPRRRFLLRGSRARECRLGRRDANAISLRRRFSQPQSGRITCVAGNRGPFDQLPPPADRQLGLAALPQYLDRYGPPTRWSSRTPTVSRRYRGLASTATRMSPGDALISMRAPRSPAASAADPGHLENEHPFDAELLRHLAIQSRHLDP